MSTVRPTWTMKRTANQAAIDKDTPKRLGDWSNSCCRAHDAALIELRNLRRDCHSHQDEVREAEAGFHRQQGEITQCEGIITELKD